MNAYKNDLKLVKMISKVPQSPASMSSWNPPKCSATKA